MRKNIGSFFIFVLLFVLIPFRSSLAAESGSCGTNLSLSIDDNGVLTITGTGSMEDYTSAPPPWYSYRTNIKRAVIEDGVTNIGDFAFCECESLTDIYMGSGVSSISVLSFYGCPLSSITASVSNPLYASDDGVLTKIDRSIYDIDKVENCTLSPRFDIERDTVKIMVWDSISTMKPLCQSFEIGK